MCESSCKHWAQGEIWKFPYRFLPSSPHELRNGILIHGQRTGRHAVKAIKAIASVVRFICNGTKPQEPMNFPSIFHVNGFMAVGFHPEWLAVFRWDMNEQRYRTQISVMKAIRSDCEGQRNVKMRMRMRIWMMMKMKMKMMIMIMIMINDNDDTVPFIRFQPNLLHSPRDIQSGIRWYKRLCLDKSCFHNQALLGISLE